MTKLETKGFLGGITAGILLFAGGAIQQDTSARTRHGG